MSSSQGVAAVEFAMIAPVMFLLVIGVFDIARAMIIRQQVYNAARQIPVSASSLAVQSDKSTSLTVAQVQQSLSMIFAAMPWRRSGVLTGRTGVIMSSVTFIQANPNCVASTSAPCSLVPRVAWSVAYFDPPGREPGNVDSFETATRPCGQLGQTSPSLGSSGDLTSLPTLYVVNPDPILVVDVHYQFTPYFFSFIVGSVNFWASGYFPVRSVAPNTIPATQYTKYDITNQNAGAGKCPGYS